MKIVYHEKFREVYSGDPAAKPGRIECILEELKAVEGLSFVEAEDASEEDVRLVHEQGHINYVKKLDLYEVALLAVGGAIKAGELASRGEPSFGLIRPPGHHASSGHSWGFCYFNNVAVSVERLRRKGLVKRVLIVDFDLHYGDGTANVFAGNPDVTYYHLPGGDRVHQLSQLSAFLSEAGDYDLVAVSAGFDRHVEDWGGVLETRDYRVIGEEIKRFAEESCYGRRFAVLEGGYNLKVLGKNVKAFIEGFS